MRAGSSRGWVGARHGRGTGPGIQGAGVGVWAGRPLSLGHRLLLMGTFPVPLPVSYIHSANGGW